MTNSKTNNNLSFCEKDYHYMGRALELARIGLGQVWPNPTVGCVLVKNDIIIAEGRTRSGGRPHGERVALDMAGDAARGATAYVSLEPCAHTGKTPPCAEALIVAGVTRVVYAVKDSDMRVAGKGKALLEAAGVKVEVGLMASEAAEVNQGFFTRVLQNRPFVILKTATSFDGKIAYADGNSKWITGDDARAQGHLIRSTSDAILVGINTVLADDPSLTCRLEGLEDRSPVRIVLDGNLRIPVTSKLVQTSYDVPTWIVTQSGDEEKIAALKLKGCKIIIEDNIRDLKTVLTTLADEGITRLMVEGGAKVIKSFLEAGIVDELKWFRAPNPIGPEGRDALDGLDFEEIKAKQGLFMKNNQKFGKDTLETFVRRG